MKDIDDSIREEIEGSAQETEEVHEFAELIQVKQYGDEYWMAFRDISEKERKEIKVRSDVDYIAMMTDVDLEEA